MYHPLLFIHIIAAMVYFGLPFSFGRWYRVVAASGQKDLLEQTLRRFRIFNIYLCVSAGILVGTGIALVSLLNLWKGPGNGWVHAALTLMALSIINLVFVFNPGIARGASPASTKKRLVIFSSAHHTLITLLTLLMVFKPF